MNKTITSKIGALLLLTLFAFQAHAQDNLWTKKGWYKIKADGQELYMSINGSAGLEWAAPLAGDHDTQVWKITDHPAVAPNGFIQITATVGGNNYTMHADASTISEKNATITVRAGDPSTDESATALFGYDQFQRRKTDGSLPGNDALFLAANDILPAGSRYGVVPSAAGDEVKFDGGGIDKLEFVFVRDIATASISDLDASSVVISNPVSNELSIQGLSADAQQVSVFSLLGKEILSQNVNEQATLNIDVSDLSSGMYLVKVQGETGSFAKKFVKQ